jgi:DNA-binding NarL/FixJ family response regulator
MRGTILRAITDLASRPEEVSRRRSHRLDHDLLTSTVPPLRCLIIDDSLQFLDAARRILERQGISVVGIGASGDAVRLARQLRPDITLVDIDLGEEDGLAVIRRLAHLEGAPAGKLVLISTHAEDEFVDLIEASPAIGFVPKAALSAQAIQALLDGDREGNP